MSHRYWCFTSYAEALNPLTDHAAFQYTIYKRERCTETSRLHWQGYLECKRSVALGTAKTIIGDPRVHLEPRRGTQSEAIAYVKKEETSEGDPIELGEIGVTRQGNRTDLVAVRKRARELPNLAAAYNEDDLLPILAKYPKFVEACYQTRVIPSPPELELRDWEEEMVELIMTEEPVHRRIIWLWSYASGTGKTTFMEWLSGRTTVLPIDTTTKQADLYYAYDRHRVIWMDSTRASNTAPNYQLLEQISNTGQKLSTKFHSCIKYFCCHVVVTSNFAPDETLIPNRCRIINIDPE